VDGVPVTEDADLQMIATMVQKRQLGQEEAHSVRRIGHFIGSFVLYSSSNITVMHSSVL
jgi:hypothetical protein